MAGEMSQSEVTRENYPDLFALRDALKRRGIASSPRPFDQYQGPYLSVPGVGSVWYSQDEDAAAVWMSDKRRVYPGGLWIIEGAGASFATEGAHHVHPEQDRMYEAGCYTLRQAARRITALVRAEWAAQGRDAFGGVKA